MLQIKTKTVSCHTADSKPVKQEVNGKVILPPLVFLSTTHSSSLEVQGFESSRGPGVEPGTGVELRENVKNEALFIQSLNEYLR